MQKTTDVYQYAKDLNYNRAQKLLKFYKYRRQAFFTALHSIYQQLIFAHENFNGLPW